MRRPSLQFYPADWQANPKLKRCSHAEKGLWLDVLCILHDQDEYGVVRWPLREIALAAHARLSALQNLVDKGILKGADSGETCAAMIYVPRHGRKDGEPVTLIERQNGPIWYSSRMVKDEHVRKNAGASTRFGAKQKDNTKPADRYSPDITPSQRQGDGSSSSSSSSSSSAVVAAATESDSYPFNHFAVSRYVDELKPSPGLSIQQAELIAGSVDNSERSVAVWDEVLAIFKGNGHQPRYAGNTVDRYKNEMARIAAGKREPPSTKPLTVDERKAKEARIAERMGHARP